jgi:hypothetical protein
MRALSASELLGAWEWGRVQPPIQQALTLLSLACPGASLDTLARLSIGQRDARLLALREWAFGPELVSLATCPGCGERLELSFSVSDVQPLSPCQREDEAEDGSLMLSAGEYEVRFRLPNSMDLAALGEQQDVTAGRQMLLGRCLSEVEHNGEQIPAEDLPGDIVDAVVDRMAQADPQSDVQLALSCPVCGQEWQATFDIVSFFWTEIAAWARRMLHQVHMLASAYGWREADILAMNPGRRQSYLEMVDASHRALG